MINAIEKWKPGEFNPSANVEWWNSMAGQFAAREAPDADNFTMGIIKRERLIKLGNTALDIGCGGGRYSRALADEGAVVTGIDVSPKMIEAARENSGERTGVTYSVEDWHTLKPAEKGWNDAFDLVLANMTPAIIDGASFVKMIETCRGWCLMVKPFNRTNALYDELNRLVSAPSDRAVTDESIEYAFSILWSRGLRPYFAYDRQVWQGRKPLEQTIDQYTKRIGTFCELDGAKRAIIRDYITANAVNGEVEDVTNTEIVAMYWHV